MPPFFAKAAAASAAAALLVLFVSSVSFVASGAESPAPVSFRADDGVLQISSPEEFTDAISRSRKAACVYFYLPRCPACAQTKAVLLTAANKLEVCGEERRCSERAKRHRERKKRRAIKHFDFQNSIDPDLQISLSFSLLPPPPPPPLKKKKQKKKQGLATVAAVDCSSKQNQPLCAEHVKVGYPTFKAFGAIPQSNPYTGVPFKEAKGVDKQPLSPKHLIEATLAGLPESLVAFAPDLKSLEAARAEAKGKNLPLAVLFTSKSKAPPLFRAVAAELLGRAAFVAASSGDDAVAESLFGSNSGEKKAPALFVETLPEGEKEEGEAKRGKKTPKKAEASSSPSSSPARIRHAGSLTADAMASFLLPHAVSAVEAEGSDEATSSSSSSYASATADDDRATPKVVETISDEASLDEVMSRNSATLLAFYDSKGKKDACLVELEAFNSAAVELGPLARAAAVDAHLPLSSEKKNDKALLPASAVEQFLQKPGGGPVDGASLAERPCDLQVVGVPAGGEKGEPDEWSVLKAEKSKDTASTAATAASAASRPWASSRALSRFITATFPPAAVPVESEQAMAAMMTPPDAPPRTPGSTAPPKLRPVVLLFSDKGTIPPLMHALATNFGPLGFGVGVVPATAEGMRKQFRVEKVPSLVLAYMPPPEMTAKKAQGAPPQGSLAVQGYRGPIRYALLDSWLRMAAPHVGVELPADATASAAAGLLQGAGAKKSVDDSALPEIKQASKPGDLAKICPPESKTLCVVVGLRGGADPKKTRDAEALLATRRVAAAWSGQPLSFCAVDASSKSGNGRAALSSLGVDPDDAPTAAIYSPAKLRSIPMPEGADGEPQKLSEKSLNLLLDSVFTGRAQTRPVVSRPEIDEEVSAAPAADGDDDDDNEKTSSSTNTIDVEAALKKSLKKESTGSREEL